MCLTIDYLVVLFLHVLGKNGRSDVAVRLSWRRLVLKLALVVVPVWASHLPGWDPSDEDYCFMVTLKDKA